MSRSAIASASAIGGFNAGINIAQNSVTANVRIKFGETLLLNGLTDQEETKSQSGVPVLQDIPIIQYLFNNLTKTKYTQNVLVLITPRRLVVSDADLKKQKTEMLNKDHQISLNQFAIYKSMPGYQDLLNKMSSNLDITLSSLNNDSHYYKDFKMPY